MRKLLTVFLICVFVPFAYGGTLNYWNGDRYLGGVLSTEPHGKGTYTWGKTQNKYVGYWKFGKKHGQGTFTWGKGGEYPGDKIVGEWKDNKPWNAVNYNADQTIKGNYTDGKWCAGASCDSTRSSNESSVSSSASSVASSNSKGASYKVSGSGSFVAKCEKNNKLDVTYTGETCDLEWNKLGESNRCKIRNSVMKFQTYDSAGPAKLNFSSGELKHGINTYKCTLSGDIEVVEKEERTSSTSSSSSTPDLAIELEFWKLVKDSNDPDLLQAYLDEYPNGKFVPLARLKIKKLRSSE